MVWSQPHSEWFRVVWNGLHWFGMVLHRLQNCLEWFGANLTPSDLEWFGMVWNGLEWFGMVYSGLEWFRMVYTDSRMV